MVQLTSENKKYGLEFNYFKLNYINFVRLGISSEMVGGRGMKKGITTIINYCDILPIDLELILEFQL